MHVTRDQGRLPSRSNRGTAGHTFWEGGASGQGSLKLGTPGQLTLGAGGRPGLQICKSPNLQISESPNLQISKSPNLQISKSPNLQISSQASLRHWQKKRTCRCPADPCVAARLVYAFLRRLAAPALGAGAGLFCGGCVNKLMSEGLDGIVARCSLQLLMHLLV